MKEFVANHKLFSLYTIFVLSVIFVALAALWLAPMDPYAGDMRNVFLPPSSEHWLGTDKLGREMFSRLIYGTF